MSLVRYQPFSSLTRRFWPDLEEMGETLDRLMGDFPFRVSSWYPAVDIIEREKEFLVRAELPGLEAKDVKVELRDGTLTISGERKEEHESENGHYRRVERSHGRFYRSFVLPQAVDAEKVEAKSKDGILEIVLPKSEKALPKRIPVKGA